MKLKHYLTGITLDVRTKLLVMLALLSLPLLIISLIQLSTYQRSLNEQASMMARSEAITVAGALEAWLESRSTQKSSAVPSSDEARELYEHTRKYFAPNSDVVVTIFDAQGLAVENPTSPQQIAAADVISFKSGRRRWADNVERETSLQRVQPFGWSVAVGVPLPENTPAGRSIIVLTATWALALLASSSLAVWAVGRFTTPLRQLTASVSTLGEGQFQERVAVQTNDEVGTLAASFNAMAENLQTKFDEVKTQGAFIEEVLNSLPLGVAVLDASLVIRKANSTFAEIVGGDSTPLAGRKLFEAVAELMGLREVMDEVRRTRRAFVNYSLPLGFAGTDGEPETGTKFWDVILWPTTEQGSGGSDLILILSEVSKRVRAEKLATAAFASEKSRAAELGSVIKQMNEGVVIVDARGRYRVNPAAASILGRAPGEFRDGVTALIDDMALHDLQRNKLSPAETPIGRALDHGESVFGEHVLLLRGAVQEERVLEVSATPLIGETGKHGDGLVAVFRDITEEVRQHSEVVAAYDRLREHDRLKSAFVANVSHELRTPLNVIIGMCQLLAKDRKLPLAPLQSEAVGRMERNAFALLDLVNDLLEYSRLEAGRSALHIENVDVAEVAKEVIESYGTEAQSKGLSLRAETASGLGFVRTDRNKLTQVLSNLVSNAIKFTPAGEVAVTAGPLDGERWYVEVRDTGIGMSSDALGYIFERFRQVDDRLTRSYGGVGLGLAITGKIVELLEGEITVESTQGGGSCFRITWPRTARPRTGTGSLIGNAETSAEHIPSLRARTG
jgi:signal transduction histidine kinase